MTDREYHVASFVVSARPQHVAELADRIEATAGLEVHAQARSKLIVTAEAGNVRELADMAAGLEELEHALTVAPAYHEYSVDDAPAIPLSGENE